MIATPAVRNLIREGKTHQILSSIQMGGAVGMNTMDAYLAELCLKRAITYETGMARSVDSKEFARLVETGGIAGAQGQGQGAKPGMQPARPQAAQPATGPVGRGAR
jgi:twitching motility protein PilT